MEATTKLLADDAAAVAGKLYVHGGGWDSVQVAALPATISRLALVLVIRVEYDEALIEQRVRVDLVDEDDQPSGGVPPILGVLTTGHAPGMRPGEPAFVPQALRFEGLSFDHTGGYRFRVFANDQEDPLASVPFRVVRTPSPVG